MKWYHWIVHIYALCSLHPALHCYYNFFAMGGRLRWALCLSGNPPLCFVAVSQCYIYFVVLWKINLLSLSVGTPKLCRAYSLYSQRIWPNPYPYLLHHSNGRWVIILMRDGFCCERWWSFAENAVQTVAWRLPSSDWTVLSRENSPPSAHTDGKLLIILQPM